VFAQNLVPRLWRGNALVRVWQEVAYERRVLAAQPMIYAYIFG